MIDIFVYLFENFYDFSAPPKPDALARKLNAVGFDALEISAALNWLSELRSAHNTEFKCHPKAVRIYSTTEQDKLGKACLGFIAFLETAQLITPNLRELIIERGMLLDDAPIPLAKFKIIVLMVLWSRDNDLEPLIIEELLYEAEDEYLH